MHRWSCPCHKNTTEILHLHAVSSKRSLFCVLDLSLSLQERSLSGEFAVCWESLQSVGRVRSLSGELGLPQHPSTTATTFSKITSLVGLQELPGGRMFTTRTKQITLPSAEFTDAVFGGGSDVQRVTEAFAPRVNTPLQFDGGQGPPGHIAILSRPTVPAVPLGRFSYSSS